MPLFGLAGAALDYGRLYQVQSQTQQALDAAVLAGTRILLESGQESAAIDTARQFFDFNMQSQNELANSNIAFKINSAGNGVEAVGNADLKTVMLGVFNIKTLKVFGTAGATAEAVAGSGSDMEISLMLDVTGSMCDDGVGPCTTGAKLDALKQSAGKLIDTVIWKDQSRYTSRVAIVPFSTRVRVGQDGAGSAMMTALTNLPSTWSGWYEECIASSGGGGSEGNGNWTCSTYQTQYMTDWKIMPCVTDRFYNASNSFDITDDAPRAGKWLNAHDGGRMTQSWDSSSTPADTELGDTSADPATHWNFRPDGACADVANADEIMPLTSDSAALKAKISGLEAFGSTAGALGTAWSWYLLSPKWRSIWTGASAPGDYALMLQTNPGGKPKLRKVAILMSDGGYNTYRSWKEQDVSFVSTAAKDLCAAMKAKGIEVYSVAFDLANLSSSEQAAAQDTLQSCATDIDHFYNSLNSSQLSSAFDQIGQNIASSNVRLIR